jgi:hypothetical protein
MRWRFGSKRRWLKAGFVFVEQAFHDEKAEQKLLAGGPG